MGQRNQGSGTSPTGLPPVRAVSIGAVAMLTLELEMDVQAHKNELPFFLFASKQRVVCTRSTAVDRQQPFHAIHPQPWTICMQPAHRRHRKLCNIDLKGEHVAPR